MILYHHHSFSHSFFLNQLNHALNIIFIYMFVKNKKRVFSKCVINRYQRKKNLLCCTDRPWLLPCYFVFFFYFPFFYYNLWFMYFWQHELKVQVRYVKWVLIFQCEFVNVFFGTLFFCLIILQPKPWTAVFFFTLFSLMIMEEYCSYLKPLPWERTERTENLYITL